MKDRAKIDDGQTQWSPWDITSIKGRFPTTIMYLDFPTLERGATARLSARFSTLTPADPDSIETHVMAKAEGAGTALVEMPPCGQSTAKIRALGYRYYTGDLGLRAR